ncbi:MAG: hypothetical protein Q9227_003378 [Pyrenula ochraceoflavens]
MAAAARQICRCVRATSTKVPLKRKLQYQLPAARYISSSLPRLDRRDTEIGPPTDENAKKVGLTKEEVSRLIDSSGEDDPLGHGDPASEEDFNKILSDLKFLGKDGSLNLEEEEDDLDLSDPEVREEFSSRSPAEQEELRRELLRSRKSFALDDDDGEAELDEIPGFTSTMRELDRDTSEMRKEMQSILPEQDARSRNNIDWDFPKVRPPRRELGFWAMDEEDDEDALVEDGDDEFKDDDITSMAHAELELHRDIREYTRRAAWEMPFLSKLSKPFEKPETAQTPLRFRYTTYMGEHHPAAKKVVVSFCISDLSNLHDPQRIKLRKLLGTRYNPDTDTAKLSCERFDNPAQNKRFLGDTIASLLTEARNQEDMFEDVPMDLRHHKKKVKPVFPDEWKLTSQKSSKEGGQRTLGRNTQRLLAEREESRELAEERVPVDGEKVALRAHARVA